MKLWFISDPHFNHSNIIEYCDRPFKDVHEMNQTIVNNINKCVNENDVLFILGDVGIGTAEELKTIIESIKCKKTLILGNHDKRGVYSYYSMGFNVVSYGMDIPYGKSYFRISHYPSKSFLGLLRLSYFHIKKMLLRKRSFVEIFNRIKREFKFDSFSNNKIWTVHGHTHKKEMLSYGKNINVCCDATQFKPVHIKELLDLINKVENK